MKRWAFVLAVISGCSFSLDGPDPRRPARVEPRCETGKGRVLTDGILASAMAITTVSIAADSSAVAIVPAVIGAIFVGAAIHGNNVVEDCRKANSEYLAALPTIDPERPEPSAKLDVAAPTVEVHAPAVEAPPPPTEPAAPPPPPATTWAAFWKEVR